MYRGLKLLCLCASTPVGDVFSVEQFLQPARMLMQVHNGCTQLSQQIFHLLVLKSGQFQLGKELQDMIARLPELLQQSCRSRAYVVDRRPCRCCLHTFLPNLLLAWPIAS